MVIQANRDGGCNQDIAAGAPSTFPQYGLENVIVGRKRQMWAVILYCAKGNRNNRLWVACDHFFHFRPGEPVVTPLSFRCHFASRVWTCTNNTCTVVERRA